MATQTARQINVLIISSFILDTSMLPYALLEGVLRAGANILMADLRFPPAVFVPTCQLNAVGLRL